MKNLLKFFESYIKLTHAQDFRKKLIWQRVWSEEEDWNNLRNSFNLRWANNAIDEWTSFYPGTHFPIDYIEEVEKRKSVQLQAENKNKQWGLEIGIRYFPEKEYLPPVSLNEFFIMQKEIDLDLNMNVRDKFTFFHILELLLGGHINVFEDKHKMMYRHWLFTGVEDVFLLKIFEEKGIQGFDIATLKKQRNFEALLKYGAQTDSKLINIKRKTNRYMRWQLLKMHRESMAIYNLGKINKFIIFNKLMLDIITGKFKL